MTTSFPQQKVLSLTSVNNCYEGLMYNTHSGEVTIANTLETPLMLLKNPSNSGVCVASVIRKLTALTNQKTATFRFYSNPTITANGTANDVNNLRLVSGAPASQILAYISPTIANNGYHMTTTFVAVGSLIEEVPIIFDPGQNFLITVQVQSNNDKVSVDFSHYEINP